MLLALLLPLSLFFHLTTAALRNVTIDDTDPHITYTPPSAWQSGLRSSLNSNGSHSLGTGLNATATFTFTGVAIYYLASLWPYDVGTVIALDDILVEFVNLTDPNSATTPVGGSESAPSTVRWSKTGLENTTHTLILGAPGEGNAFAISDGFIYTTDDGRPEPSASASADMNAIMNSLSMANDMSPTQITTLPSPSSSSAAAATNSKVLAIGLGAGLTASALLAGFFFFFFYWRRRRSGGGYGYQKGSNVRDSWGKTEGLTPFLLPPSPPPALAPGSGAGAARGSASGISASALATQSAATARGGDLDSESRGLLAHTAADEAEDELDDVPALASSSTMTLPLAVKKKAVNGDARTAYGLGEKGVPLREEEYVVPPPAYSAEDV